MKRGIKEGKLIPLEAIRIIPDCLTRKSLLKIVKKKDKKALKENLSELMASMKAIGQIECVGVREFEDIPKELLKEDGLEAVYCLIFGLRRFLAAQLLGWDKIKAVVLCGGA